MCRFALICVSILILGLLAGCAATEVLGGREIFLLRHAEKEQGVADPGLTTAGFARMNRVIQLLRKQQITYVFSTDYRRTRQTAKVIADRYGLPVTLYNARDSQSLIDRLAEVSGNVVVVGHSNTIPDLVAKLGGVPGPPIDESEYDRLYRLRQGEMVFTKLLSSDP